MQINLPSILLLQWILLAMLPAITLASPSADPPKSNDRTSYLLVMSIFADLKCLLIKGISKTELSEYYQGYLMAVNITPRTAWLIQNQAYWQQHAKQDMLEYIHNQGGCKQIHQEYIDRQKLNENDAPRLQPGNAERPFSF